MQVVSAREGGAALMRTAEIVIVDELRSSIRTCSASWSTAWRKRCRARARRGQRDRRRGRRAGQPPGGGDHRTWGVVEVASRQDASEVKGWGSHEFRGLAYEGKWYHLRRWALDYRRFHGDPGNPALWEELAAFMETPRHRTRRGRCCAR